MKAVIRFRDGAGKDRQRTIAVEQNEPNAIVREFCQKAGFSRGTYIKTVTCGRVEYQWFMLANEAFPDSREYAWFYAE